MSQTLDQLKREFHPTHIHRHYPKRFSIQIIEETNRGFKTLIKDGNKKPTVQFFGVSDIYGDRRLFDPIKTNGNN